MSSSVSAGATLRVSASAPATFNAAGYAALPYTEVGEIDNLGEFGRVYELLKRNPLKTRGTVKRKGNFDEGQLNLQLAVDTDDAGQVLLKQFLNLDDPLSCRIDVPDEGVVFYMQAFVMSFKKTVGTSSSFFNVMCLLEITTSDDGTGIVEA